MQMTPQGAVRCAFCRDDEHGLPDVDYPISPQHWGVRFSPFHAIPGSGVVPVLGRHPGEMVDWCWKITLDGVDVTNQTMEFEWGDRGWVAMYHLDGDGNRMRCGGAFLHTGTEHPLIYIETGKVKAEKLPIERGS